MRGGTVSVADLLIIDAVMGLLPDTWNWGVHMRRECWERFPHHRFRRKPLVSDLGTHYGTCVTHVPWCMSGSLTHVGGENVLGIPCACATREFTYLARGPYRFTAVTPSSGSVSSGWITAAVVWGICHYVYKVILLSFLFYIVFNDCVPLLCIFT